MHAATVLTLMKAHRLSPTQLAKKIGVSRQSVSNWLNPTKPMDVRSHHLQKIALVLNVKMETLLTPLPATTGAEKRKLETSLNWDKLYPTLEDLVLAAKKWHPPAVARLVQTYGLVTAGRIVGNKKALWDRYPIYKMHIHPGTRKLLDQVWEQQWNPTSN